MSPEKQKELEELINAGYQNITGIAVLKSGKTLYENYFNGCTCDSKVHVYSVTKSIISLLIGIALDKGNIKDINQKVLDFFLIMRSKNEKKQYRILRLKI